MLAPDCEMFLQESKQNHSPKKEQASKVQDWGWKEPNINKRGLLKLPIRGKNSSSQKKLELAHLSHHFLSCYININEQFHLANADSFKYLGDRVEDQCPNK